MIVTDGFVFLHLHKSGGSFVNEFLKRFFPTAREIGYHLPWSLVPASHAHLPALGLVRNPWSYYVSWYTFQKQRPRPNALFRLLSDDGRLDFEPTVRNMLDLGTTGARLDALVAALPQGYGDRGLNLPGPALANNRRQRPRVLCVPVSPYVQRRRACVFRQDGTFARRAAQNADRRGSSRSPVPCENGSPRRPRRMFPRTADTSNITEQNYAISWRSATPT